MEKKLRNRAKGYNLVHCMYSKNIHNYVSGCGKRAGLNIRGWHYCPFCGKPLSRMWNDREEEAD